MDKTLFEHFENLKRLQNGVFNFKTPNKQKTVFIIVFRFVSKEVLLVFKFKTVFPFLI